MLKRPTYEEWLQSVPEDKRDTTHYNLRRAYELAPQEHLEAFAHSNDAHLYSAYENPETGEYEFMKSRNHPTISEELDWYYSNNPDAVEFRRKYKLDDSGEYYRYVPRATKASPKSILDEVLERRNMYK
jgi:hypothetical protein